MTLEPQGNHHLRGEKGETGPVGPKGPPFLTRGALVGFIFIVCAFLLLAHNTEVNANRIEQDRKASEARIEQIRLEQQYQGCLGGQVILMQFDKFVTDMAAIEIRGTRPSSPTYDKSATPTRKERAATYLAAKVPIFDCKKP